MLEFGNIRRVNIREIWPNEAQNFTPWLAENITRLGEVLGLDLEMVEREAGVGNFSLDILAKDLSTGHHVIIENQFGDTDHDHLGKMLTYAAGFDAPVIIWVSERVRDEHRQTIEWLNQHTDTNTQFFALEIEVIRIDDSKPAYNFKPIVLPNEWHKTKKQSLNEKSSIKGEAYRKYFQVLIDELREKYLFTKAKIAQPQNWYDFPSGISGIVYSTSFAQGKQVRTDLYLDVGDLSKNKKLFDWLVDQKQVIENEFGEPLSWERLEDRRASRIAAYREGTIESEEESLNELRQWVVQKLLTFRKVFSPRLKQYKAIVKP